MKESGRYCSYCGKAFDDNQRTFPKLCFSCQNKSYCNPLPVVVAIVPFPDGILGVRRNIEPSKGLLTLPGGYLECNETWQEGTSRELLEETGIFIQPGDFKLYDVANGIDNTIVILGMTQMQTPERLQSFSCKETMEVLLIKKPQKLGFPLHTEVVESYFRSLSSKLNCRF